MSDAVITPALLFAALLAPNAGQAPKNAAVASKVDQVCGTLAQVDHVYDKHNANVVVEEKRKPLAGVTLRLYARRKNSTCCDGLSPVEEVVTGRRGQFVFKKGIEGGDYWLVAASSKEHILDLSYEPTKTAADKCPDFEYQINDTGEFSLAVKVRPRLGTLTPGTDYGSDLGAN